MGIVPCRVRLTTLLLAATTACCAAVAVTRADDPLLEYWLFQAVGEKIAADREKLEGFANLHFTPVGSQLMGQHIVARSLESLSQ